MPNERLFGNRIVPACRYCSNGVPGGLTGDILCARHGIVAPDHKCRHFYYDPLKREPKRQVPMEKFDESSFSLEIPDDEPQPDKAVQAQPPEEDAPTFQKKKLTEQSFSFRDDHN